MLIGWKFQIISFLSWTEVLKAFQDEADYMSKAGYKSTLDKAYKDHKQHFQTYPVRCAEGIEAHWRALWHLTPDLDSISDPYRSPTSANEFSKQAKYQLSPISAGLSELLALVFSNLPSGLKCLLKFLNASCSPNFLSLFLYMLHQL